MSMISVNGIAVSIAVGQAGFKVSTINADRTTQANRALINRTRARFDYQMQTTTIEPREADFIAALIGGAGHRMSFDADLWSTRGRRPSGSLLTGITNTAPTPKFGANRLLLGGATSFVSWDFASIESTTPLVDRWLVQAWRCSTTSAVDWHLWQVRSDGAVFFDGVRDDNLDASWCQVSNGVLTIKRGTSPTCEAVDELSIIFAQPSDAQVVQAAAWQMAGNPWSDMPRVVAYGDFNERSGVFLGRVEGDQQVSSYSESANWLADSAWRNNARSVSFELIQYVAPPAPFVRKPRLWITANSPQNFLSGVAVDMATPTNTTANVGVPSVAVGAQVESGIAFAGGAALTAAPASDFHGSDGVALSACCWINVPTTAAASTRSTVIGKTQPTTTAGWSLDIITNAGVTGAQLRADLTNAAASAGRYAQTATAALLLGGWHHVAWVYNGSSGAAGWSFYVDGERIPSSIILDTSPGALNTATLLTIGRSNEATNVRPFTGSLDEIGFWAPGVELSAQEIKEIYRRGRLRLGLLWGA